MKVLLLGPYPPPRGGVTRNMLSIRDELIAAGHEYKIIATSRSTEPSDDPNVFFPASPLELLRLLRTTHHDILHIHVGGDIPNRVLGLLFACTIFARKGSVFTLHSGGYPLSEAGKAASRNSLLGRVFQRFSHVISVNEIMTEMFKRFGVAENNVRLILPFSNDAPDKNVEIPAPIYDFLSRHQPLLFSASLLEKEYDLSLQIGALGCVLEEFPDAGLLLAGSGSLEVALREEISAKPYADKVFLAGDLDHAIVLRLIDECDIMLRTTRYDGDAISVREALFLETPVIATDNGMRPDGIHLIPVGDKDALVSAIREIAARPKISKKEKTGDRSNIRAVLDLYEEILNS